MKTTKEEIAKYKAALPPEMKQYLIDRGISVDFQDALNIGWMKYKGQDWIVFPIYDRNGDLLFLKLKRPPQGPESQPKSLVYPKGATATLYPLPYLLPSCERIVLCEGEPDALVLLSCEIPAFTSTAGAGTFHDEWLGFIPQHMVVTVCFDLDEAGRKGMQKVLALIYDKRPDIDLRYITLPSVLGEGGDVTNFFQRAKTEGTDPVAAFFALETPYKPANDGAWTSKRNLQIVAPRKARTFAEWRGVIEKNFPDLLSAAEAMLSVTCQLLLKDITNCFALVLVDVPSAGKTIVINCFDSISGITYSSDSFTPASFVSNASNVAKEKLAEIDLLPRIRHKTFLFRDLATIFSNRDDDLLKNLGILTRVLDGEGFATDTGIHGRRELVGDYLFMFVAGSTPIQPRVWRAMGTLGPRIFFLGLHTRDKSEEELADQLQDEAYKLKELACREVTQDFLRTLWQAHRDGMTWNKKADSRDCLKVIVRCAKLLARLRGQVQIHRDRMDSEGKEYVYTVPVVEKPDRINQCLYNLARGHALAMGRTQIAEEDMHLVVLLAFDSAPGHRSKLMHKLIESNGQLRTDKVEEFLGCSDETARKEMKTLCVLGICKEFEGSTFEPQLHIRLADDLRWFLSDECKQLLRTASKGLGVVAPSESAPASA
ncbi:MAG: toprim domain-containing protein [Candidatus Peribacteraceae bacterium]|nr:toprim domain-containing protein [Candidatus Peribacteraceae bacterium]